MSRQLVTVRHRRLDGRLVRVRVPALPGLLVLSPLALLAVPAGVIAGLATRVSPMGALRGIVQLLWALPGAQFEIEQGRTAVLVNLKLFGKDKVTVNEQRRQILQMLAEGKINADEAERLIDALDRERPESSPGAVSRTKPRAKYLRVVVNATDSSGGDEPSRVNVRVPLQLLRAGVRIASLIPPQVLTKVNAELAKSGVPIDLTQLKPQDIEELIEQLADFSVDVDDPEAKVQVYCE
jgi:hypothetical protein